jgi:hypothetical protein
VHALVTIGAPFRWSGLHPALRIAFGSPALVGRLSFRGSRRLARAGLGVLKRFPRALSLYMNAEHVDLTHATQMAETVEDPIPRVNRDIAHWMRAGDMVLRGVNVTDAMRAVDLPLLVVVSNRDGIVPEPATLSVLEAWGGADREVLRVGDDAEWYAHADLFIGHRSASHVFGPIARWLHARA